MTGRTDSPDTLAAFDALEYRADRTFAPVHLEYRRDAAGDLEIWRNGAPHLRLGPGYRLLRTRACGVCSTDLDRHHLPFPLPQVIGHEVVAVDEHGRRCVVEINASPRVRGIAGDCPDCGTDLGRHCPRRLVLGIHDVPGGFAPWIVAPSGAVVAVPDEVPDDVAVLVEPFAAAWNAVETIAPREGDAIAVLGPRKLGMLVIAALAAWRRRTGGALRIAALVRRPGLHDAARRAGADEVMDVTDVQDGAFDVVVDTTGNPDALERAVALARREVHLKSTHGRPSAGLLHGTAFVVDELRLWRFAPDRLSGIPDPIAWLCPSASPPGELSPRCIVDDDALRLRERVDALLGDRCIRGVHAAVVDDLAGADRAIRPSADERGLVRPRGVVLLRGGPGPCGSVLERAVLERDLVLSSSRCGDFGIALEVLAADARVRESVSGLITHRFRGSELARAFAAARGPDCIKAVVHHEPADALPAPSR